MAVIIMPPTTPIKELDGAFYGLSGFGVFAKNRTPVYYNPLEASPRWQFIQGSQAESYMHSYDGEVGKTTTSSGQENFVALAPFEIWEDMEISYNMTYAQAIQSSSMFQLAVRAMDTQNFIGMRTYAGYLDVYERKNGAFKSLNITPVLNDDAVGKTVTLKVQGVVVTILVDGVAMGDYLDCDPLDTLTAGYCGIVERNSPELYFGRGYICQESEQPFNGGMFLNGGFENNLDDWQQAYAWTGSAGVNTAENPATSVNEILFQNFTLDDGQNYRISANHIDGDATITFLVNDADSGVDIRDGSHEFLGNGLAVSIGILITVAGTRKSVVDSLRLIPVI